MNYTEQFVDEYQWHYAEWKRPVSKGYILYDFIYMAFSKSRNYGDGGQISDCQWVRWGQALITKQQLLDVMGWFCILFVVVATQICASFK